MLIWLSMNLYCLMASWIPLAFEIYNSIIRCQTITMDILDSSLRMNIITWEIYFLSRSDNTSNVLGAIVNYTGILRWITKPLTNIYIRFLHFLYNSRLSFPSSNCCMIYLTLMIKYSKKCRVLVQGVGLAFVWFSDWTLHPRVYSSALVVWPGILFVNLWYNT